MAKARVGRGMNKWRRKEREEKKGGKGMELGGCGRRIMARNLEHVGYSVLRLHVDCNSSLGLNKKQSLFLIVDHSSPSSSVSLI